MKSADQIVATPEPQPTRARGMFSCEPRASASEIPASARTAFQPGPNGRTFL